MRKRILFSVMCVVLLGGIGSYAQEVRTNLEDLNTINRDKPSGEIRQPDKRFQQEDQDRVYVALEESASYPGGMQEFTSEFGNKLNSIYQTDAEAE